MYLKKEKLLQEDKKETVNESDKKETVNKSDKKETVNESDKKDTLDEECPGFGSEKAGDKSACEGCPYKQQCMQVKAMGPDPSTQEIKNRLEGVKHIVVILSGKGGVGKSTVTSQFAYYLSQVKKENVGVIDIDVTGPSIPQMFNVKEERIHDSFLGWQPVYVNENLSILSIGNMLQDQHDSIIWRGPKKSGLIKQFFRDAYWGKEMDWVLIDTPPGTGDEHISLKKYLSELKIDGAILVTTPQQISTNDVTKMISFCRKSHIKILGVVENMSYFECDCGEIIKIFPTLNSEFAGFCKINKIKYLCRIPLKKEICTAGDKGTSLFENASDNIKNFENYFEELYRSMPKK